MIEQTGVVKAPKLNGIVRSQFLPKQLLKAFGKNLNSTSENEQERRSKSPFVAAVGSFPQVLLCKMLETIREEGRLKVPVVLSLSIETKQFEESACVHALGHEILTLSAVTKPNYHLA